MEQGANRKQFPQVKALRARVVTVERPHSVQSTPRVEVGVHLPPLVMEIRAPRARPDGRAVAVQFMLPT